jgi:hypothetical protein
MRMIWHLLRLKAPILLALATVISLSGCANPFAPQNPLGTNIITGLEKELSDEDLLKDERWQSEAGRNDLVQKLMFLCDYRFSRYEEGLLMGKAVRDASIDEIIFGLSTAASLGTSAASAKILSAVSSGITFTRNNYEKNFFESQTMPVLIRKMRALRLEKSNEINDRLTLSSRKYNVYAALVDILDYYNRGTVLGAVQAISDDTSIQELKLKGGIVSPPPAASTPAIRFGRTSYDTIETRDGTISKPRTQVVGPDTTPIPTGIDYQFLERNLILKEAFEYLSKEECRAILVEKVPGYQPATGENTRETLASKILAAADYPIKNSSAVQTLAALRAAALDEKKLKQLEDAYSQFLSLPQPPAP